MRDLQPMAGCPGTTAQENRNTYKIGEIINPVKPTTAELWTNSKVGSLLTPYLGP